MDKVYSESDYTTERIINDFHTLALGRKKVFRGYHTEKEFLPKLIRHRCEDKELEFLKLLEKKGSYVEKFNCPEELLCEGQHFGLRTRLIDFTFNPFVALFFALYNDDVDEGGYYTVIYADYDKSLVVETLDCLRMGKSFWNPYQTCVEQIEYFYDNIKKAFLDGPQDDRFWAELFPGNRDRWIDIEKKVTDRRLLFFEPRQSNIRVTMQQGLFLVPYTLNKKELKCYIERNVNKIRIDKCFRSDLLRYLQTLGMTKYRLMPDLQNICEAVVREVCEKE